MGMWRSSKLEDWHLHHAPGLAGTDKACFPNPTDPHVSAGGSLSEEESLSTVVGSEWRGVKIWVKRESRWTGLDGRTTRLQRELVIWEAYFPLP